jgi:hypothetical protein
LTTILNTIGWSTEKRNTLESLFEWKEIYEWLFIYYG